MDSDARSVTVPVSGMTCAACERRVSRALAALPGVEDVDVSMTRGRATLAGRALPDRSRIDDAIRRAGYQPEAPRWLAHDPAVWRQVTVAAVVVAAVGWIAWAVGLPGLPGSLADPSAGGLVLVLLLGLTAGFSTCMAMVGGLVLAVSASHETRVGADGRVTTVTARMRPYVAFNLGRVVGFGVLGALLGALGGAFSMPTRLTAVLVVAVALVMMLLGLQLTGVSPRLAGWVPRLPSRLGGLVDADAAATARYSDVRAAVAGAATFVLPCGFTQAVQLFALATGQPVVAGLIMATFALGTAPGLLALAAVPVVGRGDRRPVVARTVGVVVIAFALLNLVGGLRLWGFPSTTAVVAESVSDNVVVDGGVQTVTMTQSTSGYAPSDTVVYAGMPIRWEITGTARFDCSAFLRSAELGVSVDLQDGANRVDLPALAPGTYPFACVMGMYSGRLSAIPPRAS